MIFEKYKDVFLIVSINTVVIILFVLSTFFPYLININIEDIQISWVFYGWVQLIYGGWEGFILICISTVCIFFYKMKFAVFFQIIGCILIFINVLIIVFQSSLSYLSLAIGTILGIIALCGFVVNVVPMFIKRKLEKEKAREKFQVMLRRTSGDVNLKTRLLGMIKVEKQINLEAAQKMLNVPKSEIKDLIYDLVGEGKLDGEFQGQNFVIFSDIDVFISILDSSFQEWNEKTPFKEKIA